MMSYSLLFSYQGEVEHVFHRNQVVKFHFRRQFSTGVKTRIRTAIAEN